MQWHSSRLSLNTLEVNKLQTQELVEKHRADEQWNKYNKTVENTENRNIKKPTHKQIAYIVSLSRTVGLKINIDRIDSTIKASSLIERLKMLSMQMNGNSSVYERRDKKVAFGMATKLVFKKYIDSHKDYRKLKGFWKEVEELYKQYQEKQERAVKAFSLT